MFHSQLPPLKIDSIDITDFELAPSGGLQRFRNSRNEFVIKIKTSNRKITFRVLGLLLERNGKTSIVKLYDTEGARIGDIVGKQDRPALKFSGASQLRA